MSNDQPHEEEPFREISSDDKSTTTRDQERRTCLYDRFSFLEERYTEEAAAEIANWSIKQGIEKYPDKSLGLIV